MKRHAIIVAGGRGVRMGADKPKQFLEIGGKPILRHTIERFLAFDPAIDLVLVLPADQREYWRAYCRETGFLERYSMVSGGITRFHSVQNALAFVKGEGLVAVHDGVRPLVGKDLLARMYAAAEEYGAAVPVVPVVESVRKVEKDAAGKEVSAPVDREGLVVVQTPQVFQAGILQEAYRQPFRPSFTDDASVVEAAGFAVKLVPGARFNIKITTPDDLSLAGSLLTISSSWT